MSRKLLVQLLALILVFVFGVASHSEAFTWTTLDYPEAIWTGAQGISGSNIVGGYQDSVTWHGCLYNGSTWTTLDYPGADLTVANAISGSVIVGSYRYNLTYHGFLLNDSTWTALNYPGAIETQVYGISGNNIVGSYWNGSASHGFLYNGSSWTTLDYPGATGTEAFSISGSNIVGAYRNGSSWYAFLYNGSTWTTFDYPGAIETRAYGISGNNIVGSYWDGSASHGFLYNGSSWTTLDYPGAIQTHPHGIDGSNIVGYYQDAKIANHTFLYTETSLSTVIAPLHNENGLIMTTADFSNFADRDKSYFTLYRSNHNGDDIALSSDGSVTASENSLSKPVHAICDGQIIDSNFDKNDPNMTYIQVRHTNCGGRDLIAYYGHTETTMLNGTPVKKDDILGTVVKYTDDWNHLHLTLDTKTERDLFSKKYEMCNYVMDSASQTITELSNCVSSRPVAKPAMNEVLLQIGYGRVTTVKYKDSNGEEYKNCKSLLPGYCTVRLNENAIRNLGFISYFDLH